MKIVENFKANREHKFNPSLVYFGLVLLEPSILFGNASRHPQTHFSIWLALTAAHLAGGLISIFGIRIFITRTKQSSFNYLALSLMGIIVAGSASFAFNILGAVLKAPISNLVIIIFTVLLLGAFWFPQATTLGNQKDRIIKSMSLYENRLIIESRRAIRELDDFRDIEKKIVLSITSELRKKCTQLILQLRKIQNSNLSLETKSSQLAPLLAGNDLREFSLQLEQKGSQTDTQGYVSQAIRSIRLFARQYRILYWQSVRYHQVHLSVYPGILLLVILPSMLRYLNFHQIAFSVLTLTLCGLVLARLNQKEIEANRKYSLIISSILTYAIGCLPLVLQPIESRIFANNRSEYPVFILAFMVPVGYYLLIRVLQLIQPSTQNLIESGKLIVSSGVKIAVSGVIEYEFSQTLSHSWAVYIHGKILTRLASTSLRLEQARNSNDEAGFNSTIDTLIEILQSPEASFADVDRSIEDEMQSRISPWEGLVAIELAVDPTLKSFEGSRVSDLGQVFEEAISNSVRHGKSSILKVRLERAEGDDVEVIIQDNSKIKLQHEQVRYGLGTKLFNLVCDGRWGLSHDSSGTTFSARINMKGQSQ